jgi:serine/threonine protein kinase
MSDDALLQAVEAAGFGTPEQIAAARSAGGSVLDALVGAGVPRDNVMAAASTVWAMLSAPSALLAEPAAPDVDRSVLDLIRRCGAAPLAFDRGVLHVAVPSPAVADELVLEGLPTHRTYIALEQEIRETFQRFDAPPRQNVPDEDPFVRMARLARLNPVGAYGDAAQMSYADQRERILLDDGGDEMELELGSHAEATHQVGAPDVGGVIDAGPAAVPASVEIPPPAPASTPDLDSGVWGKLDRVAVSELVQMMGFQRSDCEVEIRLSDGTRSKLGFVGGQLVAVEHGDLLGDDAFFALVNRRDGRFTIHATFRSQPNISTTTPALLLEAVRRSHTSIPTPQPTPAEMPAPAAAAAPSAVPGYRLIREIGRGATAVVYLAQQEAEGFQAAVKILTPASVADAGFIRRFKREIRTHSALKHENIVGVYDFGRAGETYYLAQEYVSGGTLEDCLSVGSMPAAMVVLTLRDILAGARIAHERGVTHRDLKPGNLLVSADGRIKMTDFGLARNEFDPNRSAAGSIMGTPAYMAPEQALGNAVDERADLFTIGTIAIELLTGKNPYNRGLGPASLMAVCRADRPSVFSLAPAAPVLLCRVIERMNTLDIEKRFQNAAEVLAELAPLISAVEAAHPGVAQGYFREPATARPQLLREQSNLESARAHALLQTGPAGEDAAVVALIRATQLDPENQAAWETLNPVVDRKGYSIGDSRNPQVAELKKQLEAQPDAPGVLKRLADLHRAEGNLLASATYLSEYATRQQDNHAEHQLKSLLGDDELAPFSASAAGPALSAMPMPPSTGVATASPPPAVSQPMAIPPQTGGGPLATPPPTGGGALASPPQTGGAAFASPPQTGGAAVEPAPAPDVRPVRSRVQGTGTGDLRAPPEEKSSKGLLIAAAVGVVVIGGIAAVVLGGGEDQPPAPPPKPPVATPDPPKPPKPPPKPPDNLEVKQRARIAEAIGALNRGDYPLAIQEAGAALALDEFTKAAHDARAVRAKAYLQANNKAAAKADAELVIQRASRADRAFEQAQAVLNSLKE